MSDARSAYPALVERALRLIEARGGPVDGADLARELFGATGGPWAKLVAQVVGRDDRVSVLPDGRYALCRPERSEGPLRREATPPTTGLAAGLVVFGAG